MDDHSLLKLEMDLGISRVSFPATYTLSPQEMGVLKALAESRGTHKADWGQRFVPSTNKNSNIEVSVRSHTVGLIGEYVSAKLVKGYFDFMPSFLGDHDRSDIIVGRRGARIAVKTTVYSPPHLKLTDLKEIEDCTHISLCLYQEPKLTVQWVRPKEWFLSNYHMKDYGYGTRYSWTGD